MPLEVVGDSLRVYTADHPTRTDSPEYVQTRKKLMGSVAGGCWICEGPVDLSHPGTPSSPTGIQDHHGGGLYLYPADESDPILVGLNLFGTEWSLGFSADPVRFQAFVTQLNDVVTKLGGQPYTAAIATTDDVMAFVDSFSNANVKLCCAPGTLVRMADGTAKAIEEVAPGDDVIGGDGEVHSVEAVASRHYKGELLSADAGPWLTPDHNVITPQGWRSIGDLTSDDALYRLTPVGDDSLGMPFGIADVEFGEVHHSETHSGDLRISALVVLDAWPVPVDPVCLKHDELSAQQRIADVTAKGGLPFVSHAKRLKRFIQGGFKARGMAPRRAALPIVVIEPQTFSGAVSTARQPGVELAVAGATDGLARGSARERVEPLQATFIRARRRSGAARDDEGGERTAAADANRSDDFTGAASLVGAIVAARRVGESVMASRLERSATNTAVLDHAATGLHEVRLTTAGWHPVRQIRRRHYTGIVYDITVPGPSSFVADGVVIHNCAVHHIAHEDKDTPDANGHQGVGIHNGPLPIWLGQATCEWDRFDMWGGSTGTVAVAPHRDGSTKVEVLHVSPLHSDQKLYQDHLAAAAAGVVHELPASHPHARLAHAGAHKA